MVDNRIKNAHAFSVRLAQAFMLLISLQATSAALAQDDDYINPDRPGIADGSKLVGADRFQIETGIQKEFRRSGLASDQLLFFPTLLRIGIDKRWEVRIESNVYDWQRISHPVNGTSRDHGGAPISIGTKYLLLDSDDATQPTLGTILRIFPPSGTGTFQTRHTTGDIRFAADWDFAPQWSLNPNIGVALYEDDQNRIFTTGLLAVTLSYNPSKTLSLFVDTGMQSREGKHAKSAVIIDTGLAYLPRRDMQLDFSVGVGTRGATPPRTFFSLGFSKMF